MTCPSWKVTYSGDSPALMKCLEQASLGLHVGDVLARYGLMLRVIGLQGVCSAKRHRDTPSTLGPTAILKSSVMLDQHFLSVYTAGKQQTVSEQKAGKMTDAETAAAADLSAEQHRTASMFLSGSQPAACIGQLSRR